MHSRHLTEICVKAQWYPSDAPNLVRRIPDSPKIYVCIILNLGLYAATLIY